MSSIYVLEPPTKGKVVLQTTHGPLDIELWPKEAPKAVRNFVQLCIEGYYDNTIFHRIIKSFLIQGGDPTGTGSGGESIYGGVFADEFHSRLRFKHRGLVACANSGSPHSNGSQFFMTLDRCDWLDKKHTIFGKVTGESIFNLLRLGDIETDKNDRPLDPPPKIVSVEVLWNPFDDIVPRQLPGKSLPDSTTDNVSKDQKKKAVKKLNLLSFGEEAEEEEKELAAVKEKIKSSHDVLNDPRLLKEEIPKKEPSSSDAKKKRDLQLSVREALISKKEESHRGSDPNVSESPDLSDEDEANFDVRMRLQILKKRKELGDHPIKQKSLKENSRPKDYVRSPVRTKDEDIDDQPKMEKLSLKKKGVGSEARSEHMAEADGNLLLMGHAERARQLQKMKKRRLQGRAEEVLSKLENFKKSLSAKSSAPGGKSGGEREEDLSGWRENRLTFAPGSSGKDGMARKDDPDEYVVHDPLLEKGKEKFNKMQAKQKRREREWAGKSLT
ncbi:peptidyl-prolyl cis-trans isomerase CYP57 [Telopea speciosissima]|uniref:peptidyl-prolyl cis-trans isomerase CYP57 n=1 Tax=Telopea speciosissima TaxID=54955 RepID=UPI001CC463DB|nr:peptidyl-prolyl cis-trans isomerase CYP57 [Telopea speciosissima]XP_043721276.1 peptidyl-prolyl cis-trans isomerase CYP57 [Telopea speciosissima]